MRPDVPSPLNGAARRLCCNLYYEKPTISDVNYQVGSQGTSRPSEATPSRTASQILEAFLSLPEAFRVIGGLSCFSAAAIPLAAPRSPRRKP